MFGGGGGGGGVFVVNVVDSQNLHDNNVLEELAKIKQAIGE